MVIDPFTASKRPKSGSEDVSPQSKKKEKSPTDILLVVKRETKTLDLKKMTI
jgi:hypothetical protein